MTGPQPAVEVILPDGKRIEIVGASAVEIRLAKLSATDGRSNSEPSSTEMLAVLEEAGPERSRVLAEFRLDRIAGYTISLPPR
jgi:hypothetical protein